MEDQCHVIIIYVALSALGLRNYSMNIQDLTNLYITQKITGVV